MCGEIEQARLESSEFDPRTITTIVVDDSSFMLEGIGRLLRRIECVEVRGTASDGIEGVNLAVTICPDLVLMDFQMPHMDGLTAARLIRKAHPGVKIILVTAHDLEAVKRNGFVSQVDEVICKQQLPSRLPGTIRAMFAARLRERDGRRFE